MSAFNPFALEPWNVEEADSFLHHGKLNKMPRMAKKRYFRATTQCNFKDGERSALDFKHKDDSQDSYSMILRQKSKELAGSTHSTLKERVEEWLCDEKPFKSLSQKQSSPEKSAKRMSTHKIQFCKELYDDIPIIKTTKYLKNYKRACKSSLFQNQEKYKKEAFVQSLKRIAKSQSSQNPQKFKASPSNILKAIESFCSKSNFNKTIAHSSPQQKQENYQPLFKTVANIKKLKKGLVKRKQSLYYRNHQTIQSQQPQFMTIKQAQLISFNQKQSKL